MPTYTDDYIFTGLVESIYFNLKVKEDGGEDIINEKISDDKDKPKHFVFIDPFKIEGKPQPVFPEFEN